MLHSKLDDMSQNEAVLRYLQIVAKLPDYGVHFFQVSGYLDLCNCKDGFYRKLKICFRYCFSRARLRILILITFHKPVVHLQTLHTSHTTLSIPQPN